MSETTNIGPDGSEATKRAVNLHEEIVQAMLEKNVDPFERSHRLGHDRLLLDVTMKAPKLLEGTISLKYWRDFSANKQYLESRSADLPKPTATTSVVKKTVPLATLKKDKKKMALQDVRQPASHITHSFAAPPKGFALFDSHIIGPRNPVQRLIEDLNSHLPDDVGELVSIPASARPVSPKISLSPLVTYSGDIGTPLPGGVMKLGRARAAQPLPVTVNASLPTTVELDGKRKVVGGQFPLAARFPATSPPRSLVQQARHPPPRPSTREPAEKYRGRFSENPRFPPRYTETFAPSPGSYQVARLFDHFKPRLSSERAAELIREFKEQKGIRCLPSPIYVSPLIARSDMTPVWCSARRPCSASVVVTRSTSATACVWMGNARDEPTGKM
jgi:hypothetical protein